MNRSRLKTWHALLALCALPGLASAATWNIAPSGGDFTTLSAAIANGLVQNGDVLMVAAGTYGNGNGLASPTTAQRQTLTISKQLTIIGAGEGQTIITHTSAPSTDTPCINITAPNVTIRDLTVQFGNGDVATLGRGLGIQTNQANTLVEDVTFSFNYARRGMWFNDGSNNGVLRRATFTGYAYRESVALRDTTEASATSTLIEGCVFSNTHYSDGPIAITGDAHNATIRNNFFVPRFSVLDSNTADGPYNGPGGFANYSFQEDGTNLNYIAVGTMATGFSLLVDNNTFVFQDSGITNRIDIPPVPRALQLNGTNYSATGAPATITDNIFVGFVTSPPVTVPYAFQPSGVFGGALELNGVAENAGLGQFNGTAGFNVGTRGTMTAWVKLDNTGKRNQVFEGPGNGNLEFQYRSNSGGQFYVRPYADTDFTIESGGSGVTTWQLIQFTWDRSNPGANEGVARIYKGNQTTAVTEVTTFAAAASNNTITGWLAPVDTTTGVLTVGYDPGDATRAFDGMLDDMAFFNDVLTPAELETIRTSGVSAFAADSRLVAHWNFDESAGASTAASSVNSLTMELKSNRQGDSRFDSFVVASNGTPTVSNNLYFGNETVFLQAVTDSAQVLGDPRFRGTGATTEEFYTPLPDSPAIGAASDGGTIGAVQLTQPTIVANTGVTVVRTGTVVIGQTNLQATDPEQGPSQLTYTITSAPTRGTLTLNSFTQADINSGNLSYTNTTGGSSDSFSFSVTDGTTNPVTGTVAITITTTLDTDRDGSPNGIEVVAGTDQNDKDTDNDTIEDGVELAIGFNPLTPATLADRVDSDGDGIPDTWEAGNGFTVGTADQDGDGYRDGYEIALAGSPTLANPVLLGDANNDGLKNASDATAILEFFLGANVLIVPDEQVDIDRDGQTDNVDAVLLYQWAINNLTIIPFPR